MCALHSGFVAHKDLEMWIGLPERACEMRISSGLGRTSRFCETPPGTFPARFAISQSVHHETVSL
jgi:hypothetical protein